MFKEKNLILASSSPRRKALLEDLHISFEVSSSDADESFDKSLAPEEIVMELARRKADAVLKANPKSYCLGADTIVYHNGNVLGKPASREEAFQSLKGLSGVWHAVYTGVSIAADGKHTVFYEKTNVLFWELTDEEINAYLDTGEPFDKAGAYGIQGVGRLLVKEIKGDYFTVVGLPISRTIRELRALGFNMPH
ncbi:Maf family protein [Niallia taxi]|uniref:dTTP/UTP pyrophosphatase n=1 Tax=Niallia taxi TaxID=2499688 RepID=A0A3S2UGK9_9BACI|nr:Maf family protein [Niallia taxi]MCM3215206.1 Maf family protein [Niallia taxi]MDK8639507.1 Maf family protein [Niallia taxi]MED4037462.1 Maf family protein [Niallia taxi]MED4055907.1 Maf family protein [Niallia taxi]MED4117903.1 Maf family protein [Niallia taxi]